MHGKNLTCKLPPCSTGNSHQGQCTSTTTPGRACQPPFNMHAALQLSLMQSPAGATPMRQQHAHGARSRHVWRNNTRQSSTAAAAAASLPCYCRQVCEFIVGDDKPLSPAAASYLYALSRSAQHSSPVHNPSQWQPEILLPLLLLLMGVLWLLQFSLPMFTSAARGTKLPGTAAGCKAECIYIHCRHAMQLPPTHAAGGSVEKSRPFLLRCSCCAQGCLAAPETQQALHQQLAHPPANCQSCCCVGPPNTARHRGR